MGGNRPGPFLRTSREEPNDLMAERILEGLFLNRSVFCLTQAAPLSCPLVGQAGNLGLGERFLFDEDPLALVATPRPAEPHHDRGKSARPFGSPGECGVTGRQEDQVVEVRSFEAERSVSLHEQEIPGAAAFGAVPLLEW